MGDSELNSLLARAVRSNLDIQVPLPGFQQACAAEAVFFGPASRPELQRDAWSGREPTKHVDALTAR